MVHTIFGKSPGRTGVTLLSGSGQALRTAMSKMKHPGKFRIVGGSHGHLFGSRGVNHQPAPCHIASRYSLPSYPNATRGWHPGYLSRGWSRTTLLCSPAGSKTVVTGHRGLLRQHRLARSVPGVATSKCPETLVQLIESFYMGARRIFQMNGACSRQWHDCNMGIAQDCPLSPMLASVVTHCWITFILASPARWCRVHRRPVSLAGCGWLQAEGDNGLGKIRHL